MKKEPTYEELKEKVERLKERIAYLERMLYGSKSDKRMPSAEDMGAGLFDDFFEEALTEKIKEAEKAAEAIKREGERRRSEVKRKSTRPEKYHYAGLPEEWRTELPEGIDLDEYEVIGEDVTRILHRAPSRLWVECIKRPKLRKKSEKDSLHTEILQKPAPRAVIGGGHVAADFLSKLVVDKFAHHLPEYRQVKMYTELGVKLPTSTINDWVHAVANKLYPAYESQCELVRRRSDYLQVDEVPWRIADQKDKCRKGYAWQFLDARSESVGLYFYYLKGSRSGTIARAQLKDYKGAVQTDGYGVYDYFETVGGVTLLGCMAHVRRKFTEAQKSFPTLAATALDYIGLLYELEANLRARNATCEEIRRERQEKAIPIIDTFEKWIEASAFRCTPKDLMGKALDYAYKLLPRLRRYTEDGRYHIDNNDVERGQRPSVMGRKNYLFSQSDSGAEDNAVFYTLLGSCDIVGVNKLEWMEYILKNLTEDSTEEDILKMLPYNYKNTRG